MSIDRAEALRKRLARHRGLAVVPPVRTSPLAGVTSLADAFARVVAEHGDRTAVRCAGAALSYRELAARVTALAALLGDDRRPVAILLDRSIDMVVAALAVIHAGASYVPIDPATPETRAAAILADADPSLVVTSREYATRAGDVPVLLVDEPVPAATPRPAAPSGLDTRAYVIFTSGTTGRPKGVQVTHGNLLRLFTSTDQDYAFGPADVWSLFHSFAFDFSVWEMWGPLLHGGCLVVVPSEVAKDPVAFRALLRSEGVTMLSQTPTAFNQLIAEDTRHPDRLPLRWVVFGGEALHFADLTPWVAKYGDDEPRLANMYGITETTVHASFRRVCRADLATTGSPIGVPLSDLDFVLVGDDLAPVAAGETGEIVVTGPGVAMGYLNRPELTAERFITVDGVRGYRSGDLAARAATGEYTYHGRKDDQVKIRGFRIELGEVEGAVRAVPGLAQAAVVVRDLPEHGPSLVAYAVAEGAPSTLDIRRHLATVLPEYMIPVRFEFLDEFPMNRNGKLDRAALPAPTGPTAAVPQEATDEVTARVHDIVAHLLGAGTVRLTANFFELGGHSLLATRVLAGVQEAFGVTVPLRDFLRTPTVRALADAVRAAAGPVLPASALIPLHHNDDPATPVVVAIPGVLGFGLSFAQLSAHMPDRPWYAVNLRDLITQDFTLPSLVASIADLVTSAVPGRPVHLVGHSYGGCLAYYLVTELRDRGHEVAGLVLLDAVEPLELAEELAGTKDYRMWEFLTHVAAVFPDATTAWADALPDFSPEPDETVAEAERLLDADVLALFDRGLVAAFHDYLLAADLTWPAPSPVSCPALLVNATRTVDGVDRRHDLSWAELLGAGLTRTTIDATHIGMVQAPHAADLAELMSGFFTETPPMLYPARVS